MLSQAVLLTSSFGLGALHALEPGHGKTIVAAYLVGSRGRWYHAIHLGIVVTITHTVGIIALGLLAAYGLEQFETKHVSHWIELAAAVILLAVGGAMFWSRLSGAGHHHHHHHHHGPFAHRHDHDDQRHHAQHDHGHTHEADEKPSVWSLTALGITGGILPCPAATAPLLYGVTTGQPMRGVLAVLAFSLGLALVLVLVGLAVLRARQFVEQRFGQARWLTHLPTISAVIVLGFGLALAVKALTSGISPGTSS